MHELSIAVSIVEIAQEEAERRGTARVRAGHLRLGTLCGVVKEALLSCYDMACEATPLEGSQLLTEEIPGGILPAMRGSPDDSLDSVVLLSRLRHFNAHRATRKRIGSRCAGDSGMSGEPRLVKVRKNVLKQNDVIARALRERFRPAGVLAISLVSSPGAGKTAFLEITLTMLHSRYRVAALVGDLATENDAVRQARSHAPVKHIITGTICHLEAAMVQNALEGWDINELDFLFIENVGNLVCPSSYDLGEDLRFVLLSVTEGEDKPLKYPTIFNSTDVAVLTKWDLAAAVEFDEAAARRNMQSVRPGMDVLIASAKTGGGMAECVKFLELARSCSQFVEQGRSNHSGHQAIDWHSAAPSQF
jgi:hydrogenase nickel incorporation protein HypB